jgi:hypothetical protein
MIAMPSKCDRVSNSTLYGHRCVVARACTQVQHAGTIIEKSRGRARRSGATQASFW